MSISNRRTATARSAECECVCVNYIPQCTVNGTQLMGLFTFLNVADSVRSERVLPGERTHVRTQIKGRCRFRNDKLGIHYTTFTIIIATIHNQAWILEAVGINIYIFYFYFF